MSLNKYNENYKIQFFSQNMRNEIRAKKITKTWKKEKMLSYHNMFYVLIEFGV